MNIKDLQGYSFGTTKIEEKKTELINNHPSFTDKSLAAMVDCVVTSFIRIIIMTVISLIAYKFKLKEIADKIDLQSSDAQAEIINSGLLAYSIIIICISLFLGGMYYVFSFASKKGATIGCRLAKIKLVDKKTGGQVSFISAFIRYVSCIIPFLLAIIVIIKYIKREFDVLMIVLAVITVFWSDYGMFFKNKRGMPDFLAGTCIISLKEKKVRRFKLPFLN